jgi:membrane protein insertase Oxa1/YidC/SpoIIIJ
MSFLEKNKRGRKIKNVINLENTDVTDSLLYFFLASFYYMKKGLTSLSGMVLISIIFLVFIVRKLISKKKDTEMIDGIEVPVLKDNYDLSLD